MNPVKRLPGVDRFSFFARVKGLGFPHLSASHVEPSNKKQNNKFIKTTTLFIMIKQLLSLGVIAAASTLTSQAALVLGTDFTGVTRTTTPIATTITWTQLNLAIADSGNLTISKETGNGTPAIRTNNNADRIGVDYNVETVGSWSTQITFTTTVAMDLTNFTVDYHAISGGGVDQGGVKNGNFTMSLFSGAGVGGTQLFSDQKVELVDAGGTAGVAAADYDLSGLSDLAVGTYTIKLLVEAGNETGGNNWAFDDIALTAAVPEPSSVALLGLGGLALILRRRK